MGTILRVEFFDCSDIEKMRDGIGEKVSHFLSLIIGFVIYMAMAFIYGWKLTLTIVAYVPIAIISTTLIGKVSSENTYFEKVNSTLFVVTATDVSDSRRNRFLFGSCQCGWRGSQWNSNGIRILWWKSRASALQQPFGKSKKRSSAEGILVWTWRWNYEIFAFWFSSCRVFVWS